jgi:hypothetical protein
VTEMPRLVEEANRLKSLHRDGQPADLYEAALSCYYGISEIIVAAENSKDEWLVISSAMQIANACRARRMARRRGKKSLVAGFFGKHFLFTPCILWWEW